MALLKYFKKVAVDTLPDAHGQLLAKIPSSTIVESNRQVPKATEKERRWEEYNKISPKDKATIVKYVSEHGVAKAVRHFEDKSVDTDSSRSLSAMA